MPFRGLLDTLVRRTRGARGAIFCDHEGEAVELAIAAPQPAGCGPLSDFELKICGAQMAATLLGIEELTADSGAGPTRELRLLCEQGTLVCRTVKDGYYVAVLLAPGGRSGDTTRKLADVAKLVAVEM